MTSPTQSELMDQTKKLMAQKTDIENQLAELEQVLKQHGVGMQDALVDADGFPHPAAYDIRHARVQIIRLRNDHKDLLKAIERSLHALHSVAKSEQRSDPESSAASTSSSNAIRADAGDRDDTPKPQDQAQAQAQAPLARVNAVDPDGPAAQAGLRRGDLVIRFGSLDSKSGAGLGGLPQFVAANENSAIELLIRRDSALETLYLTPRRWSGRGLLGCHIVPPTQ
ncbi:uncharacterized protein BJ171DRAFT_492330 [Polychytrium aggregatum]|uniref:uncharacterized protein n=1 Tax=Polychytrium aggregatum TaxID=110093 RepID=UPI0022FE2E78|nr:uncharacterized protein BJ171DRAFT_492330 [Polychytrium aggregatum]KAI9208000.1 hypothetical protein BJ171DRAFT_492330 [Polychytrium aggregatum]